MTLRHTLQHLVLGGTVILVGIIVVFTMRHIPVPLLSDLPLLQHVLTPNQKDLSVPFTSQAPTGNWAEPWEDACEETSIVMVNDYYRHTSLDPAKAIAEITHILSVKQQHFGVSRNESMQTVLRIITAAHLNWHARIVTNPTLDQLKNELAEGRPIIFPIDARLVSNPYYDAVTPNYHVIVISGYDNGAQKFITQDPGTDRGHNFMYRYDELIQANHDYVEPDLQKGPQAALFTAPTSILGF